MKTFFSFSISPFRHFPFCPLCRYACLWLSLAVPLSICFPTRLYAEGQRSLTAEAVGSLLRDYVVQQGMWQPDQIKVAVRSLPPITLPPGPVKLQILKPRAGITPGVQSFLLGAEGKERPGKTGWARADIQIFDNVMVSSRPLSYQESITSEAVHLERRNISTLFTRPFTKMEDLASHQATRAIPANVILTPTMVQMPQVVHPGHLVTLVYETGRLRVEAQGQALEAGKIGEVVRVKNLSSGEILQGQVMNSRMVMISR
jgi:flagella basal body P-ring formation protein FlgA